jgi:hypothetical protein
VVSCTRTIAPLGPAVPIRDASQPMRGKAPVVGGCTVFPPDNWWNTDISNYPLDKRSSQYIAALPGYLHPDFGSNPHWGFPINIVPQGQKKVPVRFRYGSQSDPGPYPIPPDAQIEGGAHSKGDRHVLVLRQGVCKLYEMFDAYPVHGGSWRAGSGAIFPLDSNKLRPNG